MTPASRRSVASRASLARESADRACYVFCIIECSAKPSPPSDVPTLPLGSVPRTLALAPGLWLAVADVPAKDYSKLAIEQRLRDIDCVSMRAVAHEATIAGFFRRWSVIPLKLFTIFATEERALARMARRMRRQKSIHAGSQAVLQAAFLVSSRRSTAWKARARTLGLKLAKRGCRVEITGPWPPYNFVPAPPP